MSVTDAGNTNYSYNAASYLTGVTNPNSESTSYTYNDVGLPTRLDLSNGTYATYAYDANRYWLTSLANKKSDASTLSSFAYEYDYGGNPTKMTLANGDYVNYGYDNVYELTSEVKKDSGNQTLFSASYSYDAGGNRTQSVINGNTTNYTYDDANKMTAAGSTSFGYDNNGSLTSKTVGSDLTTYSYNEANQMTGITYPDQSTNSFTYYSSGLRRSKTDSSGTRVYIHDGLNLLGEWDSGGNLQAYWTWGLGLISQRRASTSHWYHFDRMGNVKQLTNSGQTVTDTYDTDAWGANGSSSGSTVNPFRFGGQLAYFTDSDSGLLRLGVRYLDPANGRFTQRDPMPDVLLPYAYVGQRPTAATDATGLAQDCKAYTWAAWYCYAWWAEGLHPDKNLPTGVLTGSFDRGEWRTGDCSCPPGQKLKWEKVYGEPIKWRLVYNGTVGGLIIHLPFRETFSVGGRDITVTFDPEIYLKEDMDRSRSWARLWLGVVWAVWEGTCVPATKAGQPDKPGTLVPAHLPRAASVPGLGPAP